MDNRDLPSAFAFGSTDCIAPTSRASPATVDNAYAAVFWFAEHAGATASHAALGATSAPPCAAEPTSERASDRCASGALSADEGMDVDEADTTDGGDTDGVDTSAPLDREMDASEVDDDDGDDDESDMDEEERAQWAVRRRCSRDRSRRR